MAAPPPRTLRWSSAAEARLGRIPSFVRGVVASRVEQYARERGVEEITPEMMRDLRSAMPVDFAKRRPFFLRDED
jgi:hypothetical protein